MHFKRALKCCFSVSAMSCIAQRVSHWFHILFRETIKAMSYLTDRMNVMEFCQVTYLPKPCSLSLVLNFKVIRDCFVYIYMKSEGTGMEHHNPRCHQQVVSGG